MANYRQVPMLRAAARKAFNDKRINNQEYQEIMALLGKLEEDSKRNEEVDLEARKQSIEIIHRPSLAYQSG